MEKYKLLYNSKNIRDKSRWVDINEYIKDYHIEVVRLDRYFSGTMKERLHKLRELARNTVDVNLDYAGLPLLINMQLHDIPDEEYIVTHPNDCLKSFILIVMDHLGSVLEVIPNSTDRSSKFGTIGRYFEDFE